MAATLGAAAQKTGGKSPGTRGKTMAMLRAELIKAREYAGKAAPCDGGRRRKGPSPTVARDLRLETLGRVLAASSR